MKPIVLGVALCAVLAAFLLGRVTAPDSSPKSGDEDDQEGVVLRIGDQLEVPAIGLFCTTSVELQVRKLLCNRSGPQPRYQVIFEPGQTAVIRIGDPGDRHVFLERE
jgi:hypothetical protein